MCFVIVVIVPFLLEMTKIFRVCPDFVYIVNNGKRIRFNYQGFFSKAY